jgi:hypothetical protein
MTKAVGGKTGRSNSSDPYAIEGSKGSDGRLYGTAYEGGARTSDVINWRLRVFDEAGMGDRAVKGSMEDYTVTDTVVSPFSFTGQVFYNLYKSGTASGTRLTSSSQYLFTLGSRKEGDTSVRIQAGSSLGSGSTMLAIGSAEDDSDDTWFSFGTGAAAGQVKIERDNDGQEVMTIHFEGTKYLLPGGHWMDICAHTMFVADRVIISEAKYNDVILTPEQDYDAADVVNGRALTRQTFDPATGKLVTVNEGVESGASVMLTQGYTTESWKKITENGDTGNTARSDESSNFITLDERHDTFKYDLYMIGPDTVMTKAVFIDDLPQVGDHSSFVTADKRNSAFKVSFDEDNPAFAVTLAKSKGGAETALQPGTEPGNYQIQVSSKTEFEKSTDWEGAGDGWTDITAMVASGDGEGLRNALENARSVRVIIIDDGAWVKKPSAAQYLMGNKCQVHISFNGKIDDPSAEPGQFAWNSFGYRYQVPLTQMGSAQNSTGITLEAQPLNVGVRFPSAPSLEKRLIAETPVMEPVYEEVEVTETVPVLDDEGNQVYDESGNPVTEEVTKTEKRQKMHEVEKPVYDPDTGEPVLDDDGKPVTKTVEEPVMQPAMQPAVDEDGTPKLDADGNQIMEPVMELTEHPAVEDIPFDFIIYKGDAIDELKDAQSMTNEQIARILATQGREYIHVPLTVKEGESSAKRGLQWIEHPSTYDAGSGSFVDDESKTWKWINGDSYTLIEMPMGEYRYQLASMQAGSIVSDANNLSFTNASNTVVKLIGTNEYSPEYVSVSGTKQWDDAGNQDGKRPSSITVRLLADGEEVDNATVTAKDKWSWSFDNLLKYHENGVEIEYQVTEDAIDGYSTDVEVGVDDPYRTTITNSYTPGKTSLMVAKAWDDEGNMDGSRPGAVTMRLLANGKDTGKTLKLTAKNNWTGTFGNLDIYKGGKRIAYSVEEEAVSGYESTLTGDAEEGFTVVNTHEPEKSGKKSGMLFGLPITGDPTTLFGVLALLLVAGAVAYWARKNGYGRKGKHGI